MLAMAVAAGCSAPAAPAVAPTSDEPATGAQAPASTISPADAAVSMPSTAGDIAAPATVEQPAQPEHEANRDFTPSDPTAVTLAAGRPQLIEFYADW